MLRELQVTMNKPANSEYKAETKTITGTPVLKNEADKTFKSVTTETASNIFLVDKERQPSGLNCARKNMSDYDTDFTTVQANEYGKLVAYYDGERFATDQFVATGLEIGKAVSAENGKFVLSTVASHYVYCGIHTDNGHDLAIIEVVKDAVKNA